MQYAFWPLDECESYTLGLYGKLFEGWFIKLQTIT